MKLAHAVAVPRKDVEGISIKQEGGDVLTFNSSDIDEIVEARLEEIFDAVNTELKKIGKAGQLPSGVVLTGGTAQLKHITDYAKHKLGLAARVGKASGYAGVAENIENSAFATVAGLMLLDSEVGGRNAVGRSGDGFNSKSAMKQASGFISKFLTRFKP